MYIIALAAIALIVYCGIVQKKNMWGWICFYWAVLTVKNVLDVIR